MMFRLLQIFLQRSRAASAGAGNFKVLLIFLLLLWYSASGFLYFETQSKPDLKWSDGFWWALVTMTTVGYGDYFPTTFGGRYFVGVPTLIFGIGFISYLISIVASSIIDLRLRRIKGMIDTGSRDHVIVVNYCNLEEMLVLVEELRNDPTMKHRHICLIDETLQELPRELLEKNVIFVRGNPTKEDVLRRANLPQASHCIILAKDKNSSHSDDQNLATLLVIENMNGKVFSIVEAIDPDKVRQFRIAGADSVICAADLTTELIAHELTDPGIFEVLDNLVDNSRGDELYTVPIKAMKTWEYKELVLWGLDNRVSLLGIIRDGDIKLNCRADEKLRENDRAIIISGGRMKELAV
jgi:voltage-gated potassium channel